MIPKKLISQKSAFRLLFVGVFLIIVACNQETTKLLDENIDNVGLDNLGDDSGLTGPATAPSMSLNINPMYAANSQTDAGLDAFDSTVVSAYSADIERLQDEGQKLADSLDATADTADIPNWDSNTAYSEPGSIVKYTDGNQTGIFINSWWIQGEAPKFYPNHGPWKALSYIDASGDYINPSSVTALWNMDAAYVGGEIVKHNNTCYKAQWWTQGDEPPLPLPANSWESPWILHDSCDTGDLPPFDPGSIVGKLPPKVAYDDETADTASFATPVVPPVIPAPVPAPVAPPTPITVSVVDFPSEGYEFLRLVTATDWDWLFPLRSGKYVVGGGTRNQEPTAAADGSKDTFSLNAFKRAVLEYNTWAKSKGYKQFLNEGTKKQQAQEFIAFWAKSARETSGSWSTAQPPWIVEYTSFVTNETTKVWKGALYWVEEVGYSTNPEGTSAAINYVDSASAFTPAANRSYYGRGVIQLSWNYNYGAFSAWLFDNGMMTDVITARDTLLSRPDYVASNGALSIMSGIWFWMTPQGAKPSSHDVMFGDVYNVSTSTSDQGLPQRNDGGTVPAAAGDTDDEAVMAYRLGTVINIVNGGLECNKAAKWHGGPPQRVSYFSAFTMYFNDQMSGLNATRVKAATNVWNEKISDSSPENLKNATCYSQKSYYGW